MAFDLDFLNDLLLPLGFVYSINKPLVGMKFFMLECVSQFDIFIDEKNFE